MKTLFFIHKTGIKERCSPENEWNGDKIGSCSGGGWRCDVSGTSLQEKERQLFWIMGWS